MKILLLGELSGVHTELRRAMEHKGHSVTMAHMGDTYRKFESDIQFYTARPGEQRHIGWLREIYSQFSNLPRLTGYDVVQIITPKFFHWKVHDRLMRTIKRRNRAIVLVNPTCSNHFNKVMREMRYTPCNDCKHFDLANGLCIYEREEERQFELKNFPMYDAIISTHHEYSLAAAAAGFAEKNVDIPLPIDTARTPRVPFIIGDKLVIYYGETRHGVKGGKYIKEALARLQNSEYAGRIEVVITSRLTFAEYQQTLNRSHIVIDQANTYSAGMNALYAMAKGKITLTGVEPESLTFAGIQASDNPAINILPDADHIYSVLEGLILKSAEELTRISEASTEFINKYHNSVEIADKYLEVYERCLNKKAQKSSGPSV